MTLKTHRAIKLGARVILTKTSEKAVLHVAPLDMPEHYVVEMAGSLDHRLVRRDEVKSAALRRIVKPVYSAIEGGNS